jgi:multidrug resistance efflux pump
MPEDLNRQQQESRVAQAQAAVELLENQMANAQAELETAQQELNWGDVGDVGAYHLKNRYAHVLPKTGE